MLVAVDDGTVAQRPRGDVLKGQVVVRAVCLQQASLLPASMQVCAGAGPSGQLLGGDGSGALHVPCTDSTTLDNARRLPQRLLRAQLCDPPQVRGGGEEDGAAHRVAAYDLAAAASLQDRGDATVAAQCDRRQHTRQVLALLCAERGSSVDGPLPATDHQSLGHEPRPAQGCVNHISLRLAGIVTRHDRGHPESLVLTG